MAITITAKLTSGEFIKAFGDTQHVRPFTDVATEEILKRIEEHEVETGEVVDWTAWFMEACEYININQVPDEDIERAVSIDNGNWLVI